MLIEARKNFGNLVFKEIMITAYWIGLSRRLEIVLSLIMVPAIVYGKDNSGMSLDWCTKAKSTRKRPPHPVAKELLLSMVLFLPFFALGLDALYPPETFCTFP